jgi:hypothetical protein
MPQTAAPNIGVNFEFTLGTNNWKNGFDTSMVILDLMSQAYVIDQRTAEPAVPGVGDAYLLGPGAPTGTNWGADTLSIADSIAVFTNIPGQTDGSPWFYIAPREGFQVYDRTLDRYWIRIGTVWTPGGQLRRLEKLEAAAAYTAELEDAGRLVTLDNVAAPTELVIPTFATIPFPLGIFLEFAYIGTGFLDVSGATGVDIEAAGYDETAAVAGARPTFEQGEGFRLWHLANDRWILFPNARRSVIEAITAASFEPTMRNRNGTVLINNVAHTLNIPDAATVPIPIGDTLHFLNQDGANAITVTDDVAVTYATGSQDLVAAGIAAGAHAKIQKTGTNEWFVLFNEVLPT